MATNLTQAAGYWHAGKPVEAGRIIFEHLPADARPAWAGGILRLVLARSGVDTSHFERLLYTVDHPRQWANGHRCFDLLRDTTLALDEPMAREWGRDYDQRLHLFALAELVAKVTYNAAEPPDEFDEDSGWWIASELRYFVDLWNDKAFSESAWLALTKPPS